MKRYLLPPSLLTCLGLLSAHAVIFDTQEIAEKRYGPAFTVEQIGEHPTAIYHLEQLYVKHTFNDDGECTTASYTRQDLGALQPDDFELIFRDEEARKGKPLTLSTDTVRFLQFENQKVARATLTEIIFYSRGAFREAFGRVPTLQAPSPRPAPHASAPPTHAAAIAPPSRPQTVPPPVSTSTAPTPQTESSTTAPSNRSNWVIGIIMILSTSSIGYLLATHQPPHPAHEEAPPILPTSQGPSAETAPEERNTFMLSRTSD